MPDESTMTVFGYDIISCAIHFSLYSFEEGTMVKHEVLLKTTTI